MLKLGLPSKGRLQTLCIDKFAAVGVAIQRSAEDREYAGAVSGVPDVALTLLSAGDIPRALAAGEIHVGVTGEDLIREHIPAPDQIVAMPARLGFGHADLIVAVPAWWIDVETMHDLDEAAADFRRRHGRPMRVATKYHLLARRFFAARGVADYRLIDSQGATEAAPKNGAADLIVDITSSGETLRANHLRILSDGLILRSEAMLCIARAAAWGPVEHRALAALGDRFGFDVEALGLAAG